MDLPACSGLYISTSRLKLFGLNEDFYDYNTIYRTLPGSDTTYGIIGFGHSNSIQAIINEKGLVYDGYGAPEKEVTLNRNLPINDGSFIFQVMTTCETIDEVVQLYNQFYNPWLSNGQIFFADRFGNSVIIEGDGIIYKSKNYQICTNFYQSDPQSGISYGFYPCWRYNLLEKELESTSDYSVDFVKSLLDSVHVENQECPNGLNSTVYSLIVDQNESKIYVYNLHNYENVVILDIQEELNKKMQSMSLKSLFVTSVKDDETAPGDILLNQNYPNPFNPSTSISYQVAYATYVSIKIYDLLGNEIETLVDRHIQPGTYNVRWNASSLSSGIFFCVMITCIGIKKVVKLILLK